MLKCILNKVPSGEYILENTDAVFERLGGQLNGNGTGPLRKIPQEALTELKNIFDVTGGTEFFQTIEDHSKKKAAEMGIQFDSKGIDNDYFIEIYTANSRYTYPGRQIKL